MLDPKQIQLWIEESLQNSKVAVDGDGRHFEAVIVCEDFVGKNTLARQRMVNEALGEKLGNEIHALSMKTLTPEELN